MYKFKDRFVHGQRYLTRARSCIAQVQNKVNADAARYRRAFDAINSLSTLLDEPSTPHNLVPLQDEDVRGMTEGESSETHSRKKMSWIWRRHGVGNSSATDLAVSEELRIE
ncbi:hypothetical protein SCP_1702860 [Sparassis crispa]|uniref:Uncharacterized protein n=1 Tax=Sparassis crispa TaxID=139825 RepID=A0A401H6I0_9APHY|nr:hypothetical protein SCP_1702860 [Sparassis crispa]GBE89960.1 hypothetical protein SCP_1702860 [Sparassis crispa]